jgi:hypothetical protein
MGGQLGIFHTSHSPRPGRIFRRRGFTTAGRRVFSVIFSCIYIERERRRDYTRDSRKCKRSCIEIHSRTGGHN